MCFAKYIEIFVGECSFLIKVIMEWDLNQHKIRNEVGAAKNFIVCSYIRNLLKIALAKCEYTKL